MIIPGILEKSWDDIEDKLEIVYNRSLSGIDLSSQNIIYREKVKKIQIDFCDGVYVKSQTWSPINFREINSILEKGLPYWEDFDYEADLMVNSLASDNNFLDYRDKNISNMHKYIEAVAMLGFSHVVLHSDDEASLVDAILKAKDYMLLVGISSRDINIIKNILDSNYINDNSDHNNDNREAIFDKIDYIQIMGIENIGYQQQSFAESTIENIKIIKDILNKLENKKIRIQIDGAMDNDTVQRCRDAGADDFVMGSAYFNK